MLEPQVQRPEPERPVQQEQVRPGRTDRRQRVLEREPGQQVLREQQAVGPEPPERTDRRQPEPALASPERRAFPGQTNRQRDRPSAFPR